MTFLFLIIVLSLTFGLYKLIEFIEYKVFKREKPKNNISDLMNNIPKSNPLSNLMDEYKSKLSKSKYPNFGKKSYQEKNYGTTREDLIINIKNIQDSYTNPGVYDFINKNYKQNGDWKSINNKLAEKYPNAFR